MQLGWDETIRPVMAHPVAVSPASENKRKRRFDDRRNSTNVLHAQPHRELAQFKRQRNSVLAPAVPLRRRLEALDRRQLVDLVEALCHQRPEAASAVQQLLPAMSAERALEVLAEHAHKVREAIPHGSDNNDYAYLRVKPVQQELFTALADYMAGFVPPAQVEVSHALEFLDGATEVLHGMPRWATPMNNTLLERAYDELAAGYSAVLRTAAGASALGMVPDCEASLRRHVQLSGGRMQPALDTAVATAAQAVLPSPGSWVVGARAF